VDSRSVPWKPGGATPRIANRTPPTSIVCCSTSAPRLNIDCHSRSLITAPRNGDGGVSSAAVNGRPSCIGTASTRKYEAVTN
jgi:hypothetical protein